VTYEAAEEFVIVEGELCINDHCWQPRSYGCVEAGIVRGITETRPGCIAWARFHGSPRPASAAHRPPPPPGHGIAQVDLSDAFLQPVHYSACLLRRLAHHETWFDPAFDASARVSGGPHRDALALDDFSWWDGAAPVRGKPPRPPGSPWKPDGRDALRKPGPAIVHFTSEILQ